MRLSRKQTPGLQWTHVPMEFMTFGRNLALIPILKKKISPAQWESCEGFEPNPTEREEDRRKAQIKRQRPDS